MKKFINFYYIVFFVLILHSCNKPTVFEGYNLFHTDIQSLVDSVYNNKLFIKYDTILEFPVIQFDIREIISLKKSGIVNLGIDKKHGEEFLNKCLEYFSDWIFNEHFLENKDQRLLEIIRKEKDIKNDSVLNLIYMKNLKNISINFNYKLNYRQMQSIYFSNFTQCYILCDRFQKVYHVTEYNDTIVVDCRPSCFGQGFIISNKGILYLYQNDVDEIYSKAFNENKIHIVNIDELLKFSIFYLIHRTNSEYEFIIDKGNFNNLKKTYNEIYYPQYKIDSGRLILLLCVVNKKSGSIIKYEFSYSQKGGIKILSNYLKEGKIEYRL